MPRPQPDPDDLELDGDVIHEPSPVALRVRILLRAAKMFPVGTPDYDEIDELTTMINHKVGFKRIDFEKMTEKAIEKLKSRKDKIIMKKLLESLYTLANERGLGPHLFMGRTETEMASKNWANIFHAAVVAKKLNLENAPKDEQDGQELRHA